MPQLYNSKIPHAKAKIDQTIFSGIIMHDKLKKKRITEYPKIQKKHSKEHQQYPAVTK